MTRRPHAYSRALVPAIAVAVIALAALASGNSGPASERSSRQIHVASVQVDMHEMLYKPAVLSAPVRRPFVVTFRNRGRTIHDFILLGYRAQPLHIFVPSGRTIQTSLFFRRPGTYKYHCSQPGHREAGMVGVVHVH